MILGYARVSTQDQNLVRQLKQLSDYGCDYVFEEKVSGATTDRPELLRMLDNLREGDVIVVTELARITRSTQDLFKLIETIKEKGASIKSLKDNWLDTTSDNPYSTFLLTVMAGVNQLERDLIRTRQREGIELAKEHGVYKGRPKKYDDDNPNMEHALDLLANRKENKFTVKKICEVTGVSRTVLYEGAKEKGVM
ncbi:MULTISPECIES: recombinase family protein [Bacillus]|uniref:recombinase family protein n=1 Tax=Bacillus TaxID=1386 RepID=UPI001C630C49|nr:MULTISPECIES: recombinase family protein [Bacillus]QWU46016.1 recombinase family protein [Bacillus sp. NP247]UYX50231.1 recombinase family protein [Bacillus thuringiensis]